ncbi:hypothetical protein [Noviherbaspirillum pedocola]|uniref:DUF2486 family protein n=1 Tax=Noviherbaspirillum pedocola TaxID=2801341 RepID=A0A934SXN3_9BURK|nr:hypothetical protein [Noviherbaspirillum pedocola]MBK4737418.1 hypothetical protein [Noviherbaspirillum pedocola]
MSTPPRESGIPLLTEIIEDSDIEFTGPPAPDSLLPGDATHAGATHSQPEELEPAYPLPLKPAASVTAPVPETPVPSPTLAFPPPPVTTPSPLPVEPPIPAAPQAPALSEEEWARMERRIRERILGQLLARTDAMLEERIRTGISNMLQDAVDDLAAALRHNLHKTLDDVVSRAVAQEISRLQSLKK